MSAEPAEPFPGGLLAITQDVMDRRWLRDLSTGHAVCLGADAESVHMVAEMLVDELNEMDRITGYQIEEYENDDTEPDDDEGDVVPVETVAVQGGVL